MSSIVFNSGKGSKFDWENDTITHMLVDENYIADPDDNTVSDPVADEIAGTGYSRKTIANPTETEDAGNDKVVFDADNPVWTGANFTSYVKGCVTYKNNTNDADHRLLVYNEFASGAIVAVNTGSDIFSISGDLSTEFEAGDKIVVNGSTGNDGIYTVTNVAFNSPNTDITVSEDVTNATADGTLTLVIETNGGNFTFTFPTGGLFETVAA